MSKASVYEKNPASAGTSLDLIGFAGLSEEDARRNIASFGPNEIASQQKRGLFAIVIEVVREPMFLMLVAAGALYLVMGSTGDALMLLGFVFVVMAITIVQERRTERALDALRDLSSPGPLLSVAASAVASPVGTSPAVTSSSSLREIECPLTLSSDAQSI